MRKKITVLSLAMVLLLLFSGNTFAQQDFDVFFTCNMSVQILGGVFDPGTDTLDVRGSFNGWAGPSDILSPDPFADTLYSTDVVMNLTPVTDTVQYKYVITNSSGTVWETPPYDTVINSDNRWFHTTGNEPDLNGDGIPDVLLDTVYFNDTGPEDIFTDSTDIVFEVDMRPAHAYLDQVGPIPFGGDTVSTIDSVYIASGHQLTDPEMYWVWDLPGLITPEAKALKMNDMGQDGDLTPGDSVWSITVTFLPASGINMTWKHGIQGIDNEAGFAQNHSQNVKVPSHRIYRQFGSNGDFYDSVWVYTGIEDEISKIPEDYKLYQNFPNPFNPSTKIQYAISTKQPVKLVIYNILGQKIRTLVNAVKNPGVYNAVWNGRNDQGARVSSGVYIYRFSTADHQEIKKMVLMR